jgi:hypothetical protein
MQKNNKNINWILDEFTSIDLVPKISESQIKGSETITVYEENGKKISFKSAVTMNNSLGRPINLKNFDPTGKVIEEYKYSYNGSVQKIELFENGKKSCVWIYEYNDKDLLIKSEYIETTDETHDIDIYEYDQEGRLVKILMEVYPQEVEDEEPAAGYELDWEGDQLTCISEIYGDEEEAKILFEYNKEGYPSLVKKMIYLVDDEDEDVEELIEEYHPKYDHQNRLIENSIIYHNNSTKLVINYEYQADSENANKTTHKEYEQDKLFRSIEFTEDESGNLLTSVENDLKSKTLKTETFSYTKS